MPLCRRKIFVEALQRAVAHSRQQLNCVSDLLHLSAVSQLVPCSKMYPVNVVIQYGSDFSRLSNCVTSGALRWIRCTCWTDLQTEHLNPVLIGEFFYRLFVFLSFCDVPPAVSCTTRQHYPISSRHTSTRSPEILHFYCCSCSRLQCCALY